MSKRELIREIEKIVKERLGTTDSQKSEVYVCASEIVEGFSAGAENIENIDWPRFLKKVENIILNKLSLSKTQKYGVESATMEITDIFQEGVKKASDWNSLVRLLPCGNDY